MRICALALVAFLLPACRSALAEAIPPALLGKWSQDQGCAADAMTVLFTSVSMEVRQDGAQRSLIRMDAKMTPTREIELRTTGIDYVRLPNDAPPAVGDVLRFRRDGDVLRVLAVTMQGKLVTLPPDSTVFHRCGR
jgi:hypothetical protein